MNEIKTVVLSVEEIKEVLGSLLTEKLVEILDEKLDEKLKIAKKATDDEPLKGAKHISKCMGFSETYFRQRFRDDMLTKGYVYYIGHNICSTTAKVREYIASIS